MEVAEKRTRERSIMIYGAERLEFPAVRCQVKLKAETGLTTTPDPATRTSLTCDGERK